jgi:hypothetical protein
VPENQPVYTTLSRATPIELEVAVEFPPPNYRKEQKMKVLRFVVLPVSIVNTWFVPRARGNCWPGS